MRLQHTRPQRRDGFTFIELLVVILIILLLISLLTSAVITAMNKADEVKTRNEIQGLSASLVQFQSDFNLQNAPPPSRLWLDETGTYTTPPTGFTLAQVQQVGLDTVAYLGRVWPQLRNP